MVAMEKKFSGIDCNELKKGKKRKIERQSLKGKSLLAATRYKITETERVMVFLLQKRSFPPVYKHTPSLSLCHSLLSFFLTLFVCGTPNLLGGIWAM